MNFKNRYKVKSSVTVWLLAQLEEPEEPSLLLSSE